MQAILAASSDPLFASANTGSLDTSTPGRTYLKLHDKTSCVVLRPLYASALFDNNRSCSVPQGSLGQAAYGLRLLSSNIVPQGILLASRKRLASPVPLRNEKGAFFRLLLPLSTQKGEKTLGPLNDPRFAVFSQPQTKQMPA